MKKILIGIIILLLLVIVGGVIFVTAHKKEGVPGEQPAATQFIAETVNPVESVPTSKPSVGTTTTKPKLATSTTTTSTTTTRTPVSAEERQSCLKWQMTRNASGVKPVLVLDGICSPEKSEALYQEYIASTPVVEAPVVMKTYTNATYGFSFKYPETLVCGEKTTSPYQNNTNVRSITITCGNKNLDGGVADRAGGQVDLIVDNGSSSYRTSFREHASESNAITVGGNKFYPGPTGKTLERSTYLFVATDFDRFVYHANFSGIDLTSLRF